MATPTTATQLVRALQHFGFKDEVSPEQHDDLDAEDEEVTVGGALSAETKSGNNRGGQKSGGEGKGKENGKGKGKAQQRDNGRGSKGGKGESVLSKLPDNRASTPPPAKSASLKGLLRSTQHTITYPSDSDDGSIVTRVLTSWKMADYAYKRDPCPFPTRARGLFTEKVEGQGRDAEYKIVARGYDKFFNVEEVSWTAWNNISKHSSPPYELTQKSNGCIILISSLSPRHILVTSKHSIGAHAMVSTDSGVSHSQRGEHWLGKHLERVGKTKEDLAAELYGRGLTAVAELCDDSFEEHVLAYPAHLTGLHLHGLNHNTAVLNTLPSADVTAFALAWGLLPTPYTIFPSVLAVKTYCATVEAAGGIEEPLPGGGGGVKIVPVEGFVVRGQKQGGAPGEAFFWKVKYDQPYLMYREWRELTRRLLSSYPESEVNPARLRNEESRLYLWWVNREIQRDVTKFASWKFGKGIIKTREEYLVWSKTEEAKEAARTLGQKIVEDDAKPFDRTLIVPIAVQGCGKTALGLALAHLFNMGHTQSDDFHQKKAGVHFIKSVQDLLRVKDIVFADKNNHTRKLRADLVGAASSLLSSHHHARLIALVWPLDSPTLPRDKLHALCAERVVARGDNHQTLRAGEGHEQAIWQFLGQHEPFDPATSSADGSFHEVVEMRAEWGRREALEHVVDRLVEVLGVERPSEERIEDAIRVAQGWKPLVKKVLTEKEKEKIQKGKGPRYYGLTVEQDLHALLAGVFDRAMKADPKLDRRLFDALIAEGRIDKSPHVTLVHEVDLASPDLDHRASRQKLWDHYASLVAAAATAGSGSLVVELSLGPRVVWDGRAMAIEVSGLVSSAGSDIHLNANEGGKGAAHVTVGTSKGDVRPVEGKWLLEAALCGQRETKAGGEIKVLEFEVVKCRGRLMGLR